MEKSIFSEMKSLDEKIIQILSGSADKTNAELPTLDNLSDKIRRYEEVESSLNKLKQEEKSGLRSLLIDHMLKATDLFKAEIEKKEGNPHEIVNSINTKITQINSNSGDDGGNDKSTQKKEGADEYLNKLNEILRQKSEIETTVEYLSGKVPQEKRQKTKQSVSRLIKDIAKARKRVDDQEGVTGKKHADITKNLLELKKLFERLNASLKSDPPNGKGDSPEKGLSYEQILSRIYNVDLKELLNWHKEEVELCKGELFGLAKKLDPDRTPFEILEQDLPPCESAEKMFEVIEKCVALTREKCQEYVTLPKGETCGVKPIPDKIKDYYPWGGYGYEGDVLKGDLKGHVFLNQHNYKTITRGWIYMNAIHECYPGHHAQTVKIAAADMPKTLKIAGGVPLGEGMAMRSETLMQDVYGDKTYPLFAVYRRLHAAVRIWADLVLFYLDKGPEDAISLYEKYLNLPRHVAKGQVNSQQNVPGYFTTYYYGLKKLEELQEKSGWDDKKFTELIFSCGRMSIHHLSEFMQLKDNDRDFLLNRFVD